MLKCSRCGQYYIPGYLDCACRTKQRSLHSPVIYQPSTKDHTMAMPLPGITQVAYPAASSPQSSDNVVAGKPVIGS